MNRSRIVLLILLGLQVALARPAASQALLYNSTFDGSGRPSDLRIVGAVGSQYWQAGDGVLDTGDGDTYRLGSSWAFLDTAGAESWRDVRASVDALMVDDDGGMLGLAVRWESSQRYYSAELTVTDQGVRAELLRQYDGNQAVLAGATAPSEWTAPPLGSSRGQTQPVNIALVANGNRISLELDGQEILAATDDMIPVGSVALGQSYNRVSFDNLQVAPAATGVAVADGFRVEVARGLTLAEAERLMSTLSGLDNVQSFPIGGDRFAVYSGLFSTKAAAEAHQTLVAQQFNLVPEGVVIAAMAGAQGPGRTAGDLGGYRVVAVETGDATEAQRQRADLQVLGFPSVDLRRGDSGVMVVVGPRYGSPMEAQEMIQRLIANGFPLSEVRSTADIEAAVDRAAGGPGGPVAAGATPSPGPGPGAGATPTPSAAASLPPAPAAPGGGGMMGIIIGVVAVLVVGGGVGFFLMKRKGSAPAPAPAARPSAGGLTGVGGPKPAASLTGLSAPVSRSAAPKPASQPAEPAKQPEKAAPAKQPMKAVDDGARIKPGSFAPAPAEPQKAPEPAKPDAGIKLDLPEIPGPAAAAPGGVESILDEAFGAGSETPRRRTGDEPTEAGLRLDFLMGDDEEQEPSGALPPSAPSSGAVPVALEHYFKQDFEDEAAGTHPANWNGEYEYARLVVQQGDTRDGSARCMRFEKTEGVGSAYYSCRFPDAKGRFVVEFDIRCDDKNKYLLGFYLEKDGDFRQSIATVVHRTNSRSEPTLRIMNEAAPYEFGTWRHIRMEIDLARAVLDCSIDEELVMTGHRIPNCPRLVNTLSIRDNLATTGVLLVDNIAIYPA